MAYFNHTHLAGSYVSKEQPHSKPRKSGRVCRIKVIPIFSFDFFENEKYNNVLNE